MHIIVMRHGGFAGITMRSEGDTAALPAVEKVADYPEYVVQVDENSYRIRGEPPPEWSDSLEKWHPTNPSCTARPK